MRVAECGEMCRGSDNNQRAGGGVFVVDCNSSGGV